MSIALNFTVNKSTAQSGCVEIESILVNSCAPGNDEGKNEMFRMRVGNNQLNVNDMYVTWANTNLPWNGTIMNSITAQKTAEFNATIQSCGYLVEPLNGRLPANKEVVLITSYECYTGSAFFAQLGDTLIVLYANENTNAGHVLNYVPGASPDIQTLRVDFPSVFGCLDEVSYYRTQLVTSAGAIGDEDGATVNFTTAGDPTYVNNGCVAPVTSISANWNLPGVCSFPEPIDLSPYVTGTPGGTWTGQGMNGSIFNPAGLSGPFEITYTVSISACTASLTQTIIISGDEDPSWTAPDVICSNTGNIDLNQYITGSSSGVWNGPNIIGSIFNPAGLTGSIFITYSVGSGACVLSEFHPIFIQNVDANWSNPGPFCSITTPINLNTLLPNGVSGTWEGQQVIDSIFNPSGLSGLIPISFTQTINGCSNTNTQNIEIYEDPVAPVTQQEVFVCEGEPIPLLTATSADTIYWYSDSTLQDLVNQGSSYQPNSSNVSFYLISTNGACSSETIEVNLTDSPLASVEISASGSLDLCNGSTVTLIASSSLPVVWSNGSQTNEIVVSNAGTYTVSASNTCNTATAQLTTNDISPDASFNVSSENGFSPFTLTLFPANSNGCSWYLDNNAITLLSLNQLLLENVGTYTVKQVCDNNGCIDSTSREITVEDGTFTLDLPNSFTPNGDGFNDFFKAKASGIVEFRSSIFDRWGREVFQWEGASNSWDGTRDGNPVPDGVYFYVIQGKDSTSNDFERYGSITLLRN